MFKDYQILDADSHVIEPLGIWEEYLEPEFKERAPSLDRSTGTTVIEGEPITNKISKIVKSEGAKQLAENYPISMVRGFDVESQVIAMKNMGVDISFVYPTAGLWMLAIDTMDCELAGALTRAYNNWLRDFCSYDSQLLRPVGAISRHDPAEMVPELHRIVSFGWKAVFLRPNPVKGRILSDPAYEPFWSECERLGIAVSIHEGTHCRLPSAGADRFDTRFALHACSHPIEQMMALLAMIEGGVLERHPQLKVAFLEAGCGWLLYWLWRLDRQYDDLAWEVSDNIKMPPSDYFRRQCFTSFEPAEPYLREAMDYIGSDRFIFGSDYPHMDSDADAIEQVIALSDRLPKQTVQKLLWDNPMNFYGLN